MKGPAVLHEIQCHKIAGNPGMQGIYIFEGKT